MAIESDDVLINFQSRLELSFKLPFLNSFGDDISNNFRYDDAGLFALFLKGQGHQYMFSLVKGIL